MNDPETVKKRAAIRVKHLRKQGHQEHEISQALEEAHVPVDVIEELLETKQGMAPVAWIGIAVVLALIVVTGVFLFAPGAEEVDCLTDDDCRSSEYCSDDNECEDEEDDEREEDEESDEEDIEAEAEGDEDTEEDTEEEDDNAPEPVCGDGEYTIGEEDCIEDYLCDEDDECEEFFGDEYVCEDSYCVEGSSSSGGGSSGGSSDSGSSDSSSGSTDDSGDDEGTGTSGVECNTDEECASGYYCTEEYECEAKECFDGADQDGNGLYDYYGVCSVTEDECGCTGDSDVNGYSLEDFPAPFVVDGVYNDNTLAVLRDGPITELTAFDAVFLAFYKAIGDDEEFDPQWVYDTEAENLEDYNLIVVGDPCTNEVVETVFGYTCDDWSLEEDEGIVEMVANGDNVAILIAGDGVHATVAAARALAHYERNILCGISFNVERGNGGPIVTTTDDTCSGEVSTITICEDEDCETDCDGTYYGADPGCMSLDDDYEKYACLNWVNDDGDEGIDYFGGCDADGDERLDYVCGCDINGDLELSKDDGELVSYADCDDSLYSYGCDIDLTDDDLSINMSYTCTDSGETFYEADDECTEPISEMELTEVECEDDDHCEDGEYCTDDLECADVPDCMDTEDNDGDGAYDYYGMCSEIEVPMLCEDDACEAGCVGPDSTYYDLDEGCYSLEDDSEKFACADGEDNDGDGTADLFGGCDVDQDDVLDYVCGCDIDESGVFDSEEEFVSYSDCEALGVVVDTYYGCDTNLVDEDSSYDTSETCTGDGEVFYYRDEDCYSGDSEAELEEIECDESMPCGDYACDLITYTCYESCESNADCFNGICDQNDECAEYYRFSFELDTSMDLSDIADSLFDENVIEVSPG